MGTLKKSKSIAVACLWLFTASSIFAQEKFREGTSHSSAHAFVLEGRFRTTRSLTVTELELLLFAPEPIFVNGHLLKKRVSHLEHFLKNPAQLEESLLREPTFYSVARSIFIP